MSVQRIVKLLVLTSAACGGGTDVANFDYGGGQPGAKLPEGGEIRHENVRVLGQAVQTWILAYQYTGVPASETAPFATPADGGMGTFGNCVDERTSTMETWPVKPIPSTATYLDLPKAEVTGPGITGKLVLPRSVDPVNTVGNSTFRQYGVVYGGGALNPAGPGPKGFNATLTAAMSTPGGDYTIDIGKGAPMTYHMAEAYTAPLGIGGAAPVMIADHKDLEYSWTAPPQDMGTSGKEHTRKTHFNLTFFVDPAPSNGNPAQFICFPDVDGHQVVPKTVIEALKPGGLIVNADITHYLEAREAAPGEMRRFDLVTIYCNISQYMKQ